MRHSLQRKLSYLSSLSGLIVLLAVLSSLFLQPAQAQTPTPSPSPAQASPSELASAETIWSQPVNLSRSGAANQPRIFAAQDGRLQAFWMDRFDGLMTALYNGEIWSLPAQILRVPSRFVAKPVKISAMPFLLADDKDRVHGFYYGEKDPKTGEPPLFYTQLAIGNTIWSPGVQAAESALVFNAQPVESGDLQLAYIRSLKLEPTTTQRQPIPPGVYTRRTTGGGAVWNAGSAVESSIYYRILAPEEAFMQLAATQNVAMLAWLEPRLDQVLYSASSDSGQSWSPPMLFGPKEAQVKQPLLAILPSGGALRIWQDASQSGCALYQQQMALQATQPLTTTLTPATVGQNPAVTALVLGEWGEAQQILPGLSECPSNSRFFNEEGKLYWLWGENTPALSLSAWEAGRGEWSLPQSFGFSFEDTDTGRLVQLDNLEASLANGKLAVIGADVASGEVWTTLSQVSALELAFAPPSPWSKAQAFSDPQQTASNPAVAIDGQGRAHVVWSQGSGTPGTSLYYARYDGKTASPAVEIVKAAAGEVVRQPAMWADGQERLHLAWSGGTQGEIYYTRALADQAGSASGWLPAKQVSGSGGFATSGAWPQIAQDYSGRIFILYAVPLNEGRGLYLAYSEDGGENWSSPTLIFDAAAAGWEMVDRPTLAVDLTGALHAAWTHGNLAATRLTQGIYYSRTLTAYKPPAPTATPEAGATPEPLQSDPQWSKPLEIAPAGADWPKLAGLGSQLHVVYALEGLPNHRWLDLTQAATGEAEAGWGTASRVPGWQELGSSSVSSVGTSPQSNLPPFGLTADAARLHLLAALAESTSLRYSTWSSEVQGAEGRWSQPESFNPAGGRRNFPGAVAAAPLSGSQLAVAWLALPDTASLATPIPPAPGVFLALRAITTVQPPSGPPPAPTSTPTALPSQEPTIAPTATPILSQKPGPSGDSSLSPLVLGGGLAAIIVIAIFIGILVQGKGR